MSSESSSYGGAVRTKSEWYAGRLTSSSSECFPFDPECLSEDFLCDFPPPVVTIVALAVETSAVAFAVDTSAVTFAAETAAVALSTAVVEFALDVFVVLPASVFLWWMLES